MVKTGCAGSESILACGCVYNALYEKWGLCAEHREKREWEHGFVWGLFSAVAIVVSILITNYLLFGVGMPY